MKSAKNSLYDDLKRQILTVELEPDEDLDEVILSERYGLSRTPVREIFRRLAGIPAQIRQICFNGPRRDLQGASTLFG